MKKSRTCLVITYLCIFISSLAFEKGSITHNYECINITKDKYSDLAKLSEESQLSLSDKKLTTDVASAIINSIMEIDSVIYAGDWKECYLDDLKESDKTSCYFSFQFQKIGNLQNIMIANVCSPLCCYAFICTMLGDCWYVYPMRIPSLNLYISNDGYIAGIVDTNDAYYAEIEFYRMSNVHNLLNFQIEYCGKYTSLSETEGTDNENWKVIDNTGFWVNDCFFISGRILPEPNLFETNESHVFYKIYPVINNSSDKFQRNNL